MSSLEDRAKGFENKYAHDEELSFKAIARRNKMLGLWAAEKLGKTGDNATAYAKEVVLVDFEVEGDSDVIGKLLRDFHEAGIDISEQAIVKEMERLLPIARKEISGDTI